MTAQQRLRLRLVACLLRYPDSDLLAELPELEACAATLTDSAARESLKAFLTALAETPLIHLQEHYTTAFDTCPDTSLNLTYHLMGDHEDRGKALARILAIYRRGGYAPAAPDLPDFLPMVLEFLAECPEAPDAPFLYHFLSPIADLAERLAEAGSPYRFVLEMVPASPGRPPAGAGAPDSPANRTSPMEV